MWLVCGCDQPEPGPSMKGRAPNRGRATHGHSLRTRLRVTMAAMTNGGHKSMLSAMSSSNGEGTSIP